MNNPIVQTQEQLKQCLTQAIQKGIQSGELCRAEIPQFTVEIPADSKNGDFATNAAMVCARAFRSAPVKIAAVICAHFENEFVEKTEVAGPGFINFFMRPDWYAQVLKSVDELGGDYGRTDYGKGKRVLVEFVSANPTGPMHIGNARGGAIGDCLASALDWAGYYVERGFYVNDAGNQINKLGLSLSLRYQQLYADGIEMPEDSYHGEDVVAHAKAFADIHQDRYMRCSEEERRQAMVDYALPLNIAGLERDLLKYRIKYDNWFRESTLHQNGAVDNVVKLLTEKGHTYEQDGAVWFKATEFGADKDFVLVRSNGIPTYVVPDIAYHYNKLAEREFDIAIDVLGADHHGYIPRLKAALRALGVDPDRLQPVLMQMVRLVRGNEVIKASKRSGKAITLVTLLDEVPIDAARFYFNLREANSHFDFDLDLAIEKSSQNPVYYVQYAHARICSILANLKAEGIEPAGISKSDLSLLGCDEEKQLIKHIALFPYEIIKCAGQHEPSGITRYTVELATLFHKFYNACRVKGDDAALTQARLSLCIAVKTVIANALNLLKIDAPESM